MPSVDLLRWGGILHEVDADTIGVDDGEVAIAPGFIADREYRCDASLFQRFKECIHIVHFDGEIYAFALKFGLENRLLARMLRLQEADFGLVTGRVKQKVEIVFEGYTETKFVAVESFGFGKLRGDDAGVEFHVG